MTRYAVLFVLLVGLAPVALAEDAVPPAFTVDPTISYVSFAAESTWHDFTGTAVVREGAFDLRSGQIGGRVVVDATTLRTGNRRRDRNMHDDHMLSAAHPTISFRLLTWTPDPTTPGAGQAEGLWSMVGSARRITVPVRIEQIQGTWRLRSTFTMRYTDWGISAPNNLVATMEPEVDITIDLGLRPVP